MAIWKKAFSDGCLLPYFIMGEVYVSLVFMAGSEAMGINKLRMLRVVNKISSSFAIRNEFAEFCKVGKSICKEWTNIKVDVLELFRWKNLQATAELFSKLRYSAFLKYTGYTKRNWKFKNSMKKAKIFKHKMFAFEVKSFEYCNSCNSMLKMCVNWNNCDNFLLYFTSVDTIRLYGVWSYINNFLV